MCKTKVLLFFHYLFVKVSLFEIGRFKMIANYYSVGMLSLLDGNDVALKFCEF